MLFNEPKLLKLRLRSRLRLQPSCFSALQRAEIAEIVETKLRVPTEISFSALQRAEIAEMI